MLYKEDTKNCTLLIVDDNKDLTDYLFSALKNKFKEIRVAYDGEEALRICRESSPEIVVSDIQMPRMNGYELCKHIKEDLEISHIPVILLTARNDEEMQGYQTVPRNKTVSYSCASSSRTSRAMYYHHPS